MGDACGKVAFDFALSDLEGGVHSLGRYRGDWLLLVFHRHLGWLPCREHLTQLREIENRIDGLGVRVVVVTFEAGFLAQAYVRDTELRWPLLVDESRALYQAYGMERGRWWDVFGPPAWWIYAKLLMKGRRLRASHSDLRQLGGDVLIDPGGIVRIHHVGSGPGDRPTVASIIERVEAG